MQQFLWIGLGGGMGAAMRAGLSSWVDQRLEDPKALWGILVVNLLGCLLIGIGGGWAESRGLPDGVKQFCLVGLLGGFTTYSTFAAESLRLFRNGQAGLALSYIGLHLVLGLGFAALGYFLIARTTA